MADAGPEKGAQPVNGKKRQEKRPKQEEIFVSGRQALLEQPLPAEVDGAEPSSAPAEPYELPCTLNGIMAGFSGGSLGYVFGFGPHLFTHKGPGRLKASNYKGLESAKTFAIMGGLYAAVSCYMKRIRLKEDAFNGGAAGCATGLALGWSGGPRSALQSCVGFGLFSFVIDYFSNPGAATAASLPQASHPEQHKQARFTQTSRRPYAALQRRQQACIRGMQQIQDSMLSAVLRPALQPSWLRPSCHGCCSPLPGTVFLAQLLQQKLHEGRL